MDALELRSRQLHYVTHGLRHCALGRMCPGQREVVRSWYKRRAEQGHEPSSASKREALDK